jgi:hypothetical protein
LIVFASFKHHGMPDLRIGFSLLSC